MSRLGISWALAAVLVGCGDSPLGPDVLDVSMELSVLDVAPGESFTATIRVANPATTPITIEWWGCLFDPYVRQGSVDLAWEGTALGCVLGGPLLREILPGETIVLDYELRALLAESEFVDAYEVEPSPGPYTAGARCSCVLVAPEVNFEVRPTSQR